MGKMWIVLAISAGIAVAQQQQVLAIVEKKANKVAFYTTEGKRLSDVAVGSFPHELAFSPDRKLLYVTDNGLLWMTDPGEGTNSISIIELASRRKVDVIDLGQYRRPHGMDVDPRTGRLVVTIENPFGILTVDPSARKVLRKYDVQGENPHMVIYGPGYDTAWVSNSTSGNVAVVNLASGKVETLIPTGARAQGAVRSRDGKTIFVTNSGANTISRIDTATRKVTGIIRTGDGAARIGLTPDGKTLVYNLQAGEGCGFADVATMKETARISLPGKPLSLTLSPDGTSAFLGLQDSDKVAVVSVSGRKLVRVFETPKNAGPDTIAVLP